MKSKDPSKGWSEPIYLKKIDGIDPSFFFDDNGKEALPEIIKQKPSLVISDIMMPEMEMCLRDRVRVIISLPFFMVLPNTKLWSSFWRSAKPAISLSLRGVKLISVSAARHLHS